MHVLRLTLGGVCALLVITAVGPVRAGQNSVAAGLVRNPSFEIDADSDGTPDHWTVFSGGESVRWDTTEARDGTRSIRASDSPRIQMSLRQTGLVLDPGKQYTLSAYLRSQDLSDPGSVYVTVINEGWSWHSRYLTPSAATSDWTRYTTTFTPGVSTNGKYSVVIRYAKGTTGILWLDAVQLQEGSATALLDLTEAEPRAMNFVGKNLLVNSSFELIRARNRPACWTQLREPGHVVVDAKLPGQGVRSLRLRNAGAKHVQLRQSVRLRAGNVYTLSAMLKSEGLSDPRAAYVGVINDGWTWEEVRVSPPDATTDWGRHTYTFTPPVSSGYQVVIVMNPGTRGKAWFDAIKLEEGFVATAYTDRSPTRTNNCFRLTDPLYEELLSDTPGGIDYLPYYSYAWSADHYRHFARKFAHRYCLGELFEEMGTYRLANSRYPLKEGVDNYRKYGVKFLHYLPHKGPVGQGAAGFEKTYIEEAVSIARDHHEAIWGFCAPDEIYLAAFGIYRGESDKDLAAADSEVKAQFGFGKYGIPTESTPDDQKPFCQIAQQRWVSAKLSSLFKRTYDRVKKLRPNIAMLSPTFCGGGRPADFDAMGAGFDIFTAQTRNKMLTDDPSDLLIVGCETKYLADLTRTSPWMMVHVGEYSASPTAENVREAYSQVFRNGGSGIFVLPVEWADRELEHSRYASPERWRAILEIVKRVRKQNKLKLPRDPDQAILSSSDSLSVESGILYGIPPQERLAAYALLGPVCRSWFNFVSDRQIERGVAELSDYRALYVTSAKYERLAVVKKIQQYVRNGGLLICGDAAAFSWDINGDDTSALRRDLFGVSIKGRRPDCAPIAAGDALLPTYEPGYVLERVADTVEILGQFSDGSAAIVMNRYGNGRTICFAANPFKSQMVTDARWVAFFKAIQTEAGVKPGRDIWRFKFPPFQTVYLPPPDDYCLTANNVVFEQNVPLDKWNVLTGGSYTLSFGPDAPANEPASTEIPFPLGRLTNRREAAISRDIGGGWISPSRIDLSRWTLAWKATNPIDIIFDFKTPRELTQAVLFYSGQLPAITVSASDDRTKWTTLASSVKQDSTEDVLDKRYGVQGKCRYLRIAADKRDSGQRFMLSEIEVWGR